MNYIIKTAIGFMLFSITLFSNELSDTLKINTTAQCEMCKERIEEAVNKIEGIDYVDLEVETAIVSVKFDKSKTDAEEIRKIIASCGYDADDVKKDKRAYKRLPKCCQLGGHK